MSKRFIQFANAGDFSYCGEPGYCTKCIFRFHRDFITPIEQAHGETPPDLKKIPLDQFMQLRGWRERLVEEMMPLPIADFMQLQYWVTHLRMAFYFIHDAELEATLLRHWLTTFGDDARFANVVVSSLLTRHHRTEIGNAWTRRAIELAGNNEGHVRES